MNACSAKISGINTSGTEHLQTKYMTLVVVDLYRLKLQNYNRYWEYDDVLLEGVRPNSGLNYFIEINAGFRDLLHCSFGISSQNWNISHHCDFCARSSPIKKIPCSGCRIEMQELSRSIKSPMKNGHDNNIRKETFDVRKCPQLSGPITKCRLGPPWLLSTTFTPQRSANRLIPSRLSSMEEFLLVYSTQIVTEYDWL